MSEEQQQYIDYLSGDQMRLLWRVQEAGELTVRTATTQFIDLRTLERKGYLTSRTGRSGWMYYSLSARGRNVLDLNDPLSADELELAAPSPDPHAVELAALRAQNAALTAERDDLYAQMHSPAATKLAGVLLSGAFDKLTPDEIAALPARIEDLTKERDDAYEFMRSEVNRLETLLSTALIGLEQAQIAAKQERSYSEIGNIIAETFQQLGGQALQSTEG